MNDPLKSEGNDPKTLIFLVAGAAALLVIWIVVILVYTGSKEETIDLQISSPVSRDPVLEGTDTRNEQDPGRFDDTERGISADGNASIQVEKSRLTDSRSDKSNNQRERIEGESEPTASSIGMVIGQQEHNIDAPDSSKRVPTSDDRVMRISWEQIIDNRTWHAIDLTSHLNKALQDFGKGEYRVLVSSDSKFRFRSGSKMGISVNTNDVEGIPLSSDFEFKSIKVDFQILSFIVEKGN